VICHEKAVLGGWHVVLIELPAELSGAAVEQVGYWLGRDIRGQRPKVWVERPHAIRIRGNGELVLPASVQCEFQSSKTMTFELVSEDRRRAIILERRATHAIWSSPEAGRWTLRADGRDSLNIQILGSVTQRPRLIDVRTEDGSTWDVFQLNEFFQSAAAVGMLEARLRISWALAAIGKLASFGRGVALDENAIDILASPGTKLSFQNLGCAQWPQGAPPPNDTLRPSHGLRAVGLARWLTAHARLDGKGAVRLEAPWDIAIDPQIARIGTLTWDPAFAVHLRQLAKVLRNEL
jgi:hypothetical protein